MVSFILSIFATLLILPWFIMLFNVRQEDWVSAAYGKILINMTDIEKLSKKLAKHNAKLAKLSGIELVVAKKLVFADYAKEIKKKQIQNSQIQKGNMKGVSIIDLPGYAFQRKFSFITRADFQKKARLQIIELYGKKYSKERSEKMLAQAFSFLLLGLACAFSLSSIFFAVDNVDNGLMVLSVGAILVGVLVYAIYDELASNVKKKRVEIERHFPNIVSKLALLLTSGMIMDRAWREASESGVGYIYSEMKKTSEELDNMVSPHAAYNNFLNRCNTKQTTKLASAIIQNLSKGNSEIGVLLKTMVGEAWEERRHFAKRDSEAANAKLMIPTMLLFIAIMIMIAVPIVSSISS